MLQCSPTLGGRCEGGVPGKLAVRCSTRASWLTGLWAEFIAEMARHKISPSGMNCDWLIGDILIGDTSPAGGGGGGGGGGRGGGGTSITVRSWMNSRRSVWSYDVMVKQQQQFACRLELLHPSSLCFLPILVGWQSEAAAAAVVAWYHLSHRDLVFQFIPPKNKKKKGSLENIKADVFEKITKIEPTLAPHRELTHRNSLLPLLN